MSRVLDYHLVRIGLLGQVGRFCPLVKRRFRRSERVVCRTSRGVEVGEILGVTKPRSDIPIEVDGRILRLMSQEDELLWGHLRQLSQDAHGQCAEWLRRNGQPQILLDVEPLLDGKTLYFHFLSSIEERVQEFIDQLAAVYEQQVATSEFASLLEHGCGPGCGTESAQNGCGTGGGCAVCKVAQACRRAN